MDKTRDYLFIIRRFPYNHSCALRVFFLSKNYQITKTLVIFIYHSLHKWYMLVISIAGGKTFM